MCRHERCVHMYKLCCDLLQGHKSPWSSEKQVEFSSLFLAVANTTMLRRCSPCGFASVLSCDLKFSQLIVVCPLVRHDCGWNSFFGLVWSGVGSGMLISSAVSQQPVTFVQQLLGSPLIRYTVLLFTLDVTVQEPTAHVCGCVPLTATAGLDWSD